MRFGMVVLAVICVLLGIGAPWVAPVMQGVAASILSASTVVVAEGATLVNPVLGSAISTPLVAILLIACVLLPMAAKQVLAHGGVASDRDPWACGYALDPGMPVIATTFATEVKHFLRPIYAARTAVVAKKDAFVSGFNALVRGAGKAEGFADKYLVDTVASFVSWLGQKAQRIEGGNFRVYIVYIVAALVFFLVLAVLVK